MKEIIYNNFWPTHKMKDCTIGNSIQKIKSYEHNQKNADLLISPILNWIIVMLLSYIGLIFSEILSKTIKNFIYLAATFGILMAVSLIGSIILTISFIFLKNLNMKISNCFSKN